MREFFKYVNWNAVFSGLVMFMFVGIPFSLGITIGGSYILENMFGIAVAEHSTAYGLITCLLYFTFMVGCGLFSGRASRTAPVLNGFLVGVITFLFFIFLIPFRATVKDPSPLWAHYAFAISLLPAAWLGGYIAFKRFCQPPKI